MDAFQKGLPFPNEVATFSLMICLVFFAFTTILGWNYYGERCVEYLFNRNRSEVQGYRWLYIAAVFIGPYMTVAAVWNIADVFNALMAFPNLVALLALNGVVVRESKELFCPSQGGKNKTGKQNRKKQSVFGRSADCFFFPPALFSLLSGFS